MTDMEIKCILSKFNIPSFSNIFEIRNNIWDIDNMYVLKKTDDFNRVKVNIELTRQLLDKGILVVKFIAAKACGFYVKADAGYYTLMHKIQGGNMEIHKGDCFKKAEQIGKNTALLHRALESCVYENGPRSEYDMIKYINGGYIPETNKVTDRISKEILHYINEFHPLYKKLPRQIIHKDLNPGNIIFDNAEFQGFIDFDIAQRNVRLYDLCFLLQDVFQNESEKIKNSYEIASCIFKNYDKINPLTNEEKQAIPYMFIMIGVLESIWTFNYGDNIHNDKKSLSDFHIERTNWMFSNKHTFIF